MQRQYGKPAPRRPVENPRMTALNVLQDVSHEGAYASLALGKRLRASTLARRDRDLVTELVYGTLERQVTLDYFLDKLMERPDVENVVRDILRLGAYQILYLDRVPDSAAVDESVKLARTISRDMFAGLINGVLRNLVRQKDAFPWPDRENDLPEFFSIKYSMPRWLAEKLIGAYGPEMAEAIAAYRPETHRLTVRRMPGGLSAPDFEKSMTDKGWTWAPGLLPDTYYVQGAGDIGLDKEYQRGVLTVQGESSMIAAMAVSPKRAASVLDACAAPGGKSAALSLMLQGTGRVFAWDVHEHRVELIRSMMRRLRLDNIRPAVRDATVFKEDLALSMDAVLIDAPCSGLGVMLEKPDVALRQSPEGVAELTQIQASLLDTCCRYVKPKGTLVYSTCTILPEENEQQVRAFLAKHPEFALDDAGLRANVPEFSKDHVQGGMLQLFAHRDGIDGFFIARMQRISV